MGKESILMIVGTECSPEIEKEWSRWYTEKHIPDMLQFAGFKNATRYRIKDKKEAASHPLCPKYVSLYEFGDWKAADDYNISPARQVATKGWVEDWAPRGARLLWRSYYEPIKIWGDNAPSNRPRVALLVATECKAEFEDEWNEWYTGVHVPLMLKVKGMKKASRYRLARPEKPAAGLVPESADQYPPYLAIYEFESLQDLEQYDRGPEIEAAREDWLKWAGAGKSRLLWRACYVPIKRWIR